MGWQSPEGIPAAFSLAATRYAGLAINDQSFCSFIIYSV
jgi:hypothetical protein